MQFLNSHDEKSDPSPRKQLRLPLFLRANFVVFLIAVLVVGAGGRFFWKHHKDVISSEKLSSAEHIVHFLAASVKIPLLADDTLRLSSVVRDAFELDGVLYAAVLGRNQAVQAYSGQKQLGEYHSPPDSSRLLRKDNGTTVFDYIHKSAGRVYDISRVITYREKTLGIVHLGISAQTIEASHEADLIALLHSLKAMGGGLALLLVVLASFYSLRVKQQTSRLLRVVDEYGSGNLNYRIRKIENNENGDVVRALHRMSEKLEAQAPSEAKLEQYLKFSSLDRILESPGSKVESYAFRRQGAVLFASIKGLGSYAGAEKPENIVEALNQYIRIVTKVISKHGGYVDKVIGDSVVGIFGVSLYRDNHTARAVRAAIDLQEALSVGNGTESRLLSNVCVGISSGIVLSGNIGSYSKVEYSSIGESIKEAYWLSNIGHPGEIILGEEIYNLMKNEVEAESLPVQNVFGGGDMVKSYRLLNITEKQNGYE